MVVADCVASSDIDVEAEFGLISVLKQKIKTAKTIQENHEDHKIRFSLLNGSKQ